MVYFLPVTKDFVHQQKVLTYKWYYSNVKDIIQNKYNNSNILFTIFYERYNSNVKVFYLPRINALGLCMP